MFVLDLKLNRIWDWPKNDAKMTLTDIGDYTNTVWACSKGIIFSQIAQVGHFVHIEGKSEQMLNWLKAYFILKKKMFVNLQHF